MNGHGFPPLIGNHDSMVLMTARHLQRLHSVSLDPMPDCG
jgi:hypothetical protein